MEKSPKNIFAHRQVRVGVVALALGVGVTLLLQGWLSSESVVMSNAASEVSERKWDRLFDQAHQEEKQYMGCDKSSFVAMMTDLSQDRLKLETPRQVAIKGSRPASQYEAVVTDSNGNHKKYSVRMYALENVGGASCSIGDLAFQIAILASSSPEEGLQKLADSMRAHGVKKLVNVAEMIETDPERITEWLDKARGGEFLPTSGCWTRIKGF